MNYKIIDNKSNKIHLIDERVLRVVLDTKHTDIDRVEFYNNKTGILPFAVGEIMSIKKNGLFLVITIAENILDAENNSHDL